MNHMQVGRYKYSFEIFLKFNLYWSLLMQKSIEDMSQCSSKGSRCWMLPGCQSQLAAVTPRLCLQSLSPLLFEVWAPGTAPSTKPTCVSLSQCVSAHGHFMPFKLHVTQLQVFNVQTGLLITTTGYPHSAATLHDGFIEF